MDLFLQNGEQRAQCGSLTALCCSTWHGL